MESKKTQTPEQIEFILRKKANEDKIRVTMHGHQEMIADNISYESVKEVLQRGKIIENYPEHQRGACCLVCGQDLSERIVHVVCTTSLEVIVIITVYEPKPPKWVTPFQRGGHNAV
jgi:hypothetical protein